jgi:hypothetical protein
MSISSQILSQYDQNFTLEASSILKISPVSPKISISFKLLLPTSLFLPASSHKSTISEGLISLVAANSPSLSQNLEYLPTPNLFCFHQLRVFSRLSGFCCCIIASSLDNQRRESVEISAINHRQILENDDNQARVSIIMRGLHKTTHILTIKEDVL